MEQALVDETASVVTAAGVHLSDVVEHGEGLVDDFCAEAQLLVVEGRLFLDLLPFGSDATDAVLGSVAGEIAVSDEVDEVLLLTVELGDLRGALALGDAGGLLEIGEGGVEVVSDQFHQIGADLQAAVVAVHRCLDVLDREVGLVAQFVLLARTEEVEVGAATSTDSSLDQEA